MRERREETAMTSVQIIRCRRKSVGIRVTDEGEVVVGCNTSEHVGRLTFFVCDTGVGIPDLRRNHLFSWFEAPESMADEAELDLSICQKLAQKLGGVMEIDERHQNGTRVVLILPLEK